MACAWVRALRWLCRWFGRPVAWGVVALIVLLTTVWSVMAIHYSNLPAAWLRTTLAALFGVGVVALFIFVRRRLRALGVFAVLFAVVVVWWWTIEPWLPERRARSRSTHRGAPARRRISRIHCVWCQYDAGDLPR